MASRSDELRAHRFGMRRLVGAMMTRRADAVAPRLAGRAFAAGAVIAVLSLATVAVIAVVSPAAADWRRTDAVILERETGARYVYLGGALHPVVNYASARLIVGAAATTVTVARADLVGAARGAPLAIRGAPDSLPDGADLLRGGPTVCSSADGSDSALVAGTVRGGTGLGEGGVLGRTPDGEGYLLWHAHRYHIADPTVQADLWAAAVAQPLAPAVLDAIPAASDLVSIPVDTGGQHDGLPVGLVITATNAEGKQYGLVRRDGVVTLTALQSDIVAGESPYPPRTVGGAAFAGAKPLDIGADWPATPPVLPSVAATVCVALNAAGAVSSVTVGAVPPVGGVTVAGEAIRRAWVAPGRGALVRAAGAICLLTDEVECFPVADVESLASLGYAAAPVVTMPPGVVALLPRGPTLSRSAARSAVTP